MRTVNLLSKHTVTDIFTAVYVLIDDYLQASERLGRFKLPKKRNQKSSYAELLTIVLVGEILQQKNQGLWYLLVQREYKSLFPDLPHLSRFYRVSRNFERVYADLALLIAQHDGVYLVDSKPLPICKGVRYARRRKLSEASSGRADATTLNGVGRQSAFTATSCTLSARVKALSVALLSSQPMSMMS